MDPLATAQKKVRSPSTDGAVTVNPKTSITCSNVPDGLFDPSAAKKHFSKFGKVQKIKLFVKRKMCIIEYEQPPSVERALLNAGAYDGFMFDVSRFKPKVRRRSKRDDDPDWLPDPDVVDELRSMSGAPVNRIPRQKPMVVGETSAAPKPSMSRFLKSSPVRRKVPGKEKQFQPVSHVEAPVLVATTQTSLTTSEAAAELNQIRYKISLTPDEQWRTLDARDRILRGWGGAGSRVKVGGATIGTCADMCPEKERLHRQAEHQVMTLETEVDSDGRLDPRRAVKQYSRSSADQEIPMCYELRPARVLVATCRYLLHEIADTTRPVSLADWFHFMWDRFRGIRKDITQQALCCAESIQLVEMCARFHAHCAARLADLEHTQFDPKLNTDNLTKCLQTLKHMYADVEPREKPREAEFRGYVALLNLGDANFWWEIKQLPEEIQKSDAIIFAIKVFNALDNNNYVRFFRLIRDKATYLQACILLRYFNDVRARALARIVKAYAPRGGSRFPAQDIINALAFESIDSMKSFINHYGLRFAKADDMELAVILDRNQFIEDSDPYPLSRSKELIESKRQSSVGEVIAGGRLPPNDFKNASLYSSFNMDGTLKEPALTAEGQGYNTVNDSNKNIEALKIEIKKLADGSRPSERHNPLAHSNLKLTNVSNPVNTYTTPSKSEAADTNKFSFKPAIPIASVEVLKNSPEEIVNTNNKFYFSNPQETSVPGVFTVTNTGNVFKPPLGKTGFGEKPFNNQMKAKPQDTNLFINRNVNQDPIFTKSNNSHDRYEMDDVRNKDKTLFSQATNDKNEHIPVFSRMQNKNLFNKGDAVNNNNIFTKVKNDGFEEPDGKISRDNIFANAFSKDKGEVKSTSNIFGTFKNSENSFSDKGNEKTAGNIFGGFGNSTQKPGNVFSRLGEVPKSSFAVNGEANPSSPGSLFKSAVTKEDPKYSIFQSKNKPLSVADNIFNSVKVPGNDGVYEFSQNDEEEKIKLEEQRIQEEIRKEEIKRQEEIRRQEEIKKEQERRVEERRQEMIRLEQEKLKEEQRQLAELKQKEEERRREEERKQEELRKRMDEEKLAELKRKLEEERKRFQERVEKESDQLINELLAEITDETALDLIRGEVDNLNCLLSFAKNLSEDICTELCNEICCSEMKAEIFLTEKIIKKWFFVWRKQYLRNIKRRRLLEDTPIWLTDNTPLEEALHLRRCVEKATLKNMNAIHRGYKFTGIMSSFPHPEPFKIMEIIKSSLLKRMQQINYPYDKCFFWKVTIVTPGPGFWLYRKIDLENWILKAFSDQKTHETSECLINVGKHSWNNLMDFAISVGLANLDNLPKSSDAIENANGLLFYASDSEQELVKSINDTLNHLYPYQCIPISVLMSISLFKEIRYAIEELLNSYVKSNKISTFKIFVVDSNDISTSLTDCSKKALKWMAKKYPQIPPLEIDYLKSICERYLGNEIWHRLRSHLDTRMRDILKDVYKLVSCYNASVDKLTEVLTNEDLFNYPNFPLELKAYLDATSPYPKPYEFIPSNVKTTENMEAIRSMLNKLKLPIPETTFKPLSASNMQEQIRSFCQQIGWFEDPEKVVCKVVALMPQQLSDLTIPSIEFQKHFENYDLIDFLNVIVYEKINSLNNFDKRYAIYKRSVLEDFRNGNWLYDIHFITGIKHKAVDYDDDLELLKEAKRRKLAVEMENYPMLEDKDCSIVIDSMNATDMNISNYIKCNEAVKQLEDVIEEERQKSIEFENLLRAALSDV